MKAVFLDRDGVLNAAVVKEGKPYPPASVAELVMPADTLSALTSLKKAGFLLIVATNQPDVARGTVTQESVEEIHQFLMVHLPIDRFYVCYHDDVDHCACRKPLSGLLELAARDFGIELADSFMVGDRWKDVACGKNAGCQTVLLDYDYAETYATVTQPDFKTYSLSAAVTWILAQKAK